jgi:hypothetical protein
VRATKSRPRIITPACTYINRSSITCPESRHPLSEVMQNHYLVGGKYRSVAYYMGLLFQVIQPACRFDVWPRSFIAAFHFVRGVCPRTPREAGCPSPSGQDSIVSPRVAPSSFWLEGENAATIFDRGFPLPVPADLADPPTAGPCDLPENIGIPPAPANCVLLLPSPYGRGAGGEGCIHSQR